MAPLIALIVGTALARLAGLAGVAALDGWHPALRVGLALMFMLTGVAHFAGQRRADLIAMVPPAPAPAGPAGHRHRRAGTGRRGRPAGAGDRPARRRPGSAC